MIDQEFLKGLSSKAAGIFPAAEKAKEQIEKDLFQLLQRSLSHLQVVSKEEFESQMEVLDRANQKINELEKKLEAMEQSQEKS